jgi:hypothetical protein
MRGRFRERRIPNADRDLDGDVNAHGPTADFDGDVHGDGHWSYANDHTDGRTR